MPSGPAQAGQHHQFPGVTGRHGFPQRRARGDAVGHLPNTSCSCHCWWKLVGAPGDGAVGTIGAGEGRHTTIFSEGHSIVWLTHRRRVALREEKEDCLSLATSGPVHFYSPKWIRLRMNPTARDCVDDLWKDTVLRSVTSTSDGKELNLRNSAQHALLVKRAGIICGAMEVPVAGWAGGAFCGGVGQAVSAGMAVHRMAKGNQRP
ncbi:hypothetical protein TcYC6_0077940 [Trypanosoma cruzi]|nr:hypothetical protein TcYC6_0077940 [Trypanosoma cruzi]RNC55815.1 hypothetical protein TcCL_ESM06655 [Trypanosoma cruzi]